MTPFPISNKQQRRLFVIACVSLFFLLLLPSLIHAQAPVCATHKPLTLVQVNGLITQKVADDRIAQRIESCKVNFPLDAPTIDQLAQAGASRQVVEALNHVTTADLTLSDAHAQVALLEQRVQQADASLAADRDQALAKFDADSQAERQKAAQIDPKGEFESTAQYNQRRQQNDVKLVQFDRTHQNDRAQLVARWAAKASEKEQPYHTRIEFLRAANYPDPRTVLYKSYDPDALVLTASLDNEEYRFEKVPSATAQALHSNWPKVKLAQPFTEDELHKRFLVLASASATIPGYSVKAKQTGILEGHLTRAREDMANRQYNAASGEYRSALELAPDNSEARDGMEQANAMLRKKTDFIANLPAAGVWLDKQTNLIWTMKKSDHTLNWNQANEYCQAFSAAGLTEWRLPTIQELKGINDESVTKTKRSPVPGQSTYSHMKGPVDVTGMVVFIWSSTRTTNGGAAEYWFDMTQMDSAELNTKVDRHALCVRSYSPETDGLDAPSYGVAQNSSPTQPEVASGGSDATPRGDLAGMSQQATRFYDSKRYAEAAPLYDKTCTGGNVYDCDRLGFMYSNGLGVAKDNARAIELETKACDGNNPYGCNNLGFIEQTNKDYVSAATHLTLACAGSNPNGCASLAFQYEGGLGVPKDLSKAKQLYNRGCKLGYQWACEQFKRLQ